MFARQVKDAVCLWERSLVCCSVDTATLCPRVFGKDLLSFLVSQFVQAQVVPTGWPPCNRKHMKSILTSQTPPLYTSLWNRVFETHNPKTRLLIGAQIKQTVIFGKLLLLFGVSNINDDQSICLGLWVFLQSFQQKKAVLIFLSLITSISALFTQLKTGQQLEKASIMHSLALRRCREVELPVFTPCH